MNQENPTDRTLRYAIIILVVIPMLYGVVKRIINGPPTPTTQVETQEWFIWWEARDE